LILPQALSAQSFLEQFSYEGLRFSGVGVEAGIVASDRLTRELTGAVRVDYGQIAPRVRVLLGASYFKADFEQDEISEFENQLCEIVDPIGACTIDIGEVSWTDIELDLDLQYLFESGQRVTNFLGLGLGVLLMNGTGEAIDGTFVEDALDRIDLGINLSLGTQVRLASGLYLTADLRGGLATELRTVTARTGIMYRVPR
jgi:hypothetical protein